MYKSEELHSVGDYLYKCLDKATLACRNKTIILLQSKNKMQLFFAHYQHVIVVDTDGKLVREIGNASAASGLDYHLTRNYLYYSDVNARTVYRTPLSGSGSGSQLDISLPGAWSPISVAVDWIGNILYIVDGLGQKIDIFDLDGVYHAIVLSSNLTSPVDIALDPTVGFMFITDNNRVLRSRMDGTFLTAIVTDAVYKASGISVDLPTRRVYWSDVLLDYIETVSYTGDNRQQVIRGPINVPMPSRIAVFERNVYW